jgi:single-stranded-DNA-specific exonuclease
VVATTAGRWVAEPYSYGAAVVLARELGLSETVAAILVRRGFATPELAREFLAAAEAHDPFEFRGLDAVASLVLDHVRKGSVIGVHGDYDVDGVCSTALLVRALRALGARVKPRLPSRADDGYGLSLRTVEELHAAGASLIVTVDCGIGAVQQVAAARALGMDVVVTDHHRPGAELPNCPIVHPALCGYPCEELCATGVALKLAQALFSAAGLEPDELDVELDLVALATVADLVPLRGENRSLVRMGLKVLGGAQRLGLRALMRVAGVDPQSVTEQTLGFVLGPRINAAGRLYRADAGLELLLTADSERALEIARELDAINGERQAVETAILLEAERHLSESPERAADPVHVIAGEGWHPGVIGIVASRIVERYHRPCVMIALDETGHGRGSARSIQAYDLHGGLASTADHLVRFGGHRMAAGLEIQADRVDRFRSALLEHARTNLDPADLVPVERVDAVLGGDGVRLELAEEIALLRPFGMGNPAVNLLLPAAHVAELRPMGEGRHARFTVTSAGVRAKAVAFGVGDGLGAGVGEGPPDPERRYDVTARLEANEWAGAVEPRLVVRSVHPVSGSAEGGGNGCGACDCRARGADWWDAVCRELDRVLDQAPAAAPAGPGRVVLDRRGEGALAILSDILSTHESLLVVCADVSRRRALFGRALEPGRFGRPRTVAYLSARCATSALGADEPAAALAGAADGAVCVADHTSLSCRPTLTGRFRHLFVLDPPPFPQMREALERSAPAVGGGYLHLGWGPAELELARKVLEHEYSLRPSLVALYRALGAGDDGLSGPLLEAAASGDGPHPRGPAFVGRCLRVLGELDLVSIDRSSATVRCTKTSGERVALERSEAFSAYTRLCDEGLKFLSEQTRPTNQRQAA